MFPGYSIRSVSNGVHVPSWTHPAFARLFQGVAPDWGHDPEKLAGADQLPDDAVWAAHSEAKRSEEHTSELQSLMRISYAVFCLKKKIRYNITTKYTLTN